MLRRALGQLAALAGGRAGEPETLDPRLEASFEQAAVGMAHVAVDGRWLRVNDQCSAITGYSGEELLGGTFQQITHPEDLTDDLAEVELLLSGQSDRCATDKRYIRKDGGCVWVHRTVTLIRDVAGAPDFFVVVIHDISDRKRAEVSLVESEARYRAIFDSAVDAIAAIDSHGAIQTINSAARRIFGYAPAELVGKNISTLMPQRSAGEHDAFLDRHRTAHDRTIIGIGREVEGLRSDGAAISIDLSVAEWEREGQAFFTVIMRDITPRREAEDALRTSNERLRSLQNEYAHLAAVSEMGEMAAAIAHEINQPLTAIVNNLNAGLFAAAEGFSQSAFDEAQEVMSVAAGQALRAGEIVHRLHELAGKGDGELSVEPVETLVDAAIGLALTDAAANRIQIERLAGAGGIEVRVDTVQIQLAIVNLLRNAIDALMTAPRHQERRITIATSLNEEADTVEIRISDNGPGIPEALRSTVFEPFFTSKVEGAGMGLSVCRRLIEAHDGSIELETSQGTGATFRLGLRRYGSSAPIP
jgi:two-component system sensor kinase FixL